MGKVVRGKRNNSRTSYKMQNKMISHVFPRNFNQVTYMGLAWEICNFLW